MYDTPNVLESPCLTAGLSSPVRDMMLGSITLGDTTMQNLTAEDILAMIGQDTKQTNSANHAEVYYNYNSSGSYSNSDSTVQQSTGPSDPTNETVVAPTAPSSFSGASHPGVKEIPKKSGSPRKNIPRKVSTQDVYTKIIMSVNDIRISKRTTRMTAYFSLKEENDKKLSIFLRSSLTSVISDTYRGIRLKDNKTLESICDEMVEACPKDAKLLLGRLRYNPRRFKIEEEHKHNLKYGLVAIYDYGSKKEAVLYLLDEYYPILLTDDTTEKQTMFDFTGSYTKEETEFDGDEELSDE